jgi:hypothetical protein
MPRPTRTQDCKDGNHQDCTGIVDKIEFNLHDTPCACPCHNPKAEHRYWRFKEDKKEQ